MVVITEKLIRNVIITIFLIVVFVSSVICGFSL